MKAIGSAAVLAAFAGYLGLSALPAWAVTGTCSVGNVSYSMTDVAANNADNVFCGGTNLDYSGEPPITETFFGTEYVLAYKSDEPKGDGRITFTDPITSGEAATATWAISDPTGIASQVVIVLKQASSYAAFLVTGTNGTWSIIGPGANRNTYAHVSLWYKPDATTAIPLPASALLLLSGLAGLGYLGARRRAV